MREELREESRVGSGGGRAHCKLCVALCQAPWTSSCCPRVDSWVGAPPGNESVGMSPLLSSVADIRGQ